MEEIDFDRALVAAAFDLIAETGWRRVTVADAARRAALSLERARERFPGKAAILLKFGRLSDMAALSEAPASAMAVAEVGSARDTLFGMMMRRIDMLQTHREGMLALLRELPADPATALMLSDATRRSMAWLLDGAGIPTSGLLGGLRVHGLLGVWLWTVRAWRTDGSIDLSTTMAALDNALRRAEQVEGMWPFGRAGTRSDTPAPPPDVPEAEPETPTMAETALDPEPIIESGPAPEPSNDVGPSPEQMPPPVPPVGPPV